MLTIKPIPINKATFEYFTKDNYYTQEEGIEHSQWHGKVAESLQLDGRIQPEIFDNIYHGNINNQELGNYKDGIRRHRPGLDLTFSAPKSVSVLGEVYGHQDVLDAHDKAVRRTLDYVEKHYISTRIKRGAQIDTDITKNALFAIFRHDVSRELDPQTHSHALLMNATYYDGKYRSIHADTLLPHVKEIGLLYRAALEEELQQRSYPLTYTNEKQRYFEIEGVPEQHLKLFSKRADQIKQRIKEMGAEPSPALSQRVSMYTRRKKKSLPREELKAMWSAELDEHKLNKPSIEYCTSIKSIKNDGLNDLVKRGIRRLQSTDIAFTKVDLLTAINEVAKAQKKKYSNFDIADTINEFIAKGLLIQSDAPRGKTDEVYYTTKAAKKIEHDILQRFKASKRTFASGYMSTEKIESVLNRFNHRPKPKNYLALDEGQRQAIIESLSSRDRYHIIQGNAGAGKTTLLRELRQTVIKELGIVIKRKKGQLRAFASTHVAVNEMRDSLGTNAITLDHFLVSAHDAELKRSKNEIWIIDEMSMTDIRNLKKLMEKAEIANARVIFVGDVNQLESVGPGRALYMAQKADVSMSVVDKIYRQQNPELLKVAEQMNNKQHSSALSTLNTMGNVIETGQDTLCDENFVNIEISKHLEKLKGKEIIDTVVVVPTNEDRDELTLQIRSTLKNKGILEPEEMTRSTLIPKLIPDVELKYSDQYKIGDTIRFNKAFDIQTTRWLTRRITRGEYFEIVGISKGELLIQSKKEGDRFKFELNKLGDLANGALFVYEQKTIKISPGDRLRWLDNKNKHGLMRNNKIEVLSIENNHMTVKHQGKNIILDANKLNQQHFEHQYVTTAHGSQGVSADSVIVAAPYWRKNSINQRSLLVGTTRAKKKLLVFTENLTKLQNELGGRFGDNTMALKQKETKTILSGRTII